VLSDLRDLVADDTEGLLSASDAPRDMVDAYERDIAALGGDKRAAPLLLSQGRIYEEHLSQPERAAACYAHALVCDPQHVPAILAGRRLHTELGNWALVAELLDAEARVTEDLEARAAIFAELARVQEFKLNDPKKARAALEAARKAQPRSLVHERALYQHLLSHGEDLAAYEVLDAFAAEVRDPPFRAELHRRLAELAGPKLSHPEVAVAHQRAVLERDPRDVHARAAVARELKNAKNYDALAKFHSFSAQKTDDPQAAATAHYLAARIFREQLGEDARALVELQAAIAKVPDHPLALAELERSLESAERHDELIELLLKQASATDVAEERAQRLYRVGQIQEEKLGAEDSAIERYEQVIAIRPTFLPALQALGKLYSKRQRWVDLAAMYDGEILATPEPKTKVTKLYKLAEVLELRLGDLERAVAIHHQILDLEPGYMPAFKALTRLLQRADRHQELIELYEAEVLATTDAEQQKTLLAEIARVYDDKLNAPALASEAYLRILQLDPAHVPTIRALAALYARTERYDDLIKMNEREAALTGDVKQVIDLLQRNGELCEERLNDKQRAIGCYKQVLEIAPSYVPALRSLGRLYLQKGRWVELCHMYRQELDVTKSSAQAAALHYKIGELQKDKLLNEDAAIESFEHVLAFVPAHRQAIAALSQLFRARGLWQRLIAMLEREAAASNDSVHKAARLYEAGELQEDRLNDREAALELYVAALAANVEFVPALTAQLRLLEELGDYDRMCALLQTRLRNMESSPAKLETALLLGGIAWANVGDQSLATAAYELALEMAPNDVTTLLHLERLYLARQDLEKVAGVLTRLAQLSKDSRVSVAYHLHAAAVKESLSPAQSSEAHYRAVLEIDPTNAVALRALEKQLHLAKDIAGLAVVYERLSRGAPAAVARTMVLERAELLLESGGEIAVLIPSLEALLSSDARDITALRVLRRAYDKTENWEAFLRATEQEGRVADARRAVRLLTDVGTVSWRKLNDTKRARASFEEALRRDPSALPPFFALTELLSALGAWDELARLFEARRGERGEFLVEAGSVYFAKLNRLDDARRCYEAALAIEPSRVDTHAALAEVANKSGDYAAAIEHYTRALSAQISGEQAAAVHVKLAEIHSQKLKDTNRAAEHVRAAFAANPLDPQTLDIAVLVLTHVGDGAAAKSALARVIALTDDVETKCERLCQLGAVSLRLLGDEASAIAAYEAALNLIPGHSGAIDQLVTLYEHSGNFNRVLELLRAQVELVPSENAKARSALHQRIAAVHAERLSDFSGAAVQLKHAIALEPDEASLREKQALYLSMNPDAATEAIALFRSLIERDPFRITSLRALCRLYSQLGENDKAFCFAELLVFLHAADPEETAFFLQNKDRIAMSTDQTLPDDVFRRSVLDDDANCGAGDLLAAVATELADIYPPRWQALERVDKLGPKSPDPLRTLVDSLGLVIGAPELTVVVTSADAGTVEADMGSVLIASRELMQRVQPREQRYLLARALVALKRGHMIARRYPPADLRFFLEAAAYAVFTGFEPSERALAMVKPIRGALSRKAKKAMEGAAKTFATDLRSFDPTRFLAGLDRSEIHAALTLTGDFETVARGICKQAQMPMPLAFANAAEAQRFFLKIPGFRAAAAFQLSETHFALRKRLRMGTGG
jgi:tetratricopeptide (TPR) repeat protein